MRGRFAIVPGVANWSNSHVNSGRRQALDRSSSRLGIARRRSRPGRQLPWAAADLPKLLQIQGFSGPTRARVAGRFDARGAEWVAGAWYVDCTALLHGSAEGEDWK